MFGRLVAGSLLCLSPLVATAAPRTVVVDQPLVIRLEYLQPTSITFPEGIRKVTLGWSKDDIAADHVGPHLYLQSKQPDLAGRIYVVGESGRQYVGTYKTTSPADDVVLVTFPTPATTTKAVPFSASSLLRALRTSTESTLPGQQPGNLPAPLLTDPRLVVAGMTSVRVGEFYGMMLTLRNTQTIPLVLDVRADLEGPPADDVVPVREITWPPALEPALLAAEPEHIPPGVETRLFVVFERKEVQSVR